MDVGGHVQDLVAVVVLPRVTPVVQYLVRYNAPVHVLEIVRVNVSGLTLLLYKYRILEDFEMILEKILSTDDMMTRLQALFYTHNAQREVLINIITKPGIIINTELFDHFLEEYTLTNMEYETYKTEFADILFGKLPDINWQIDFSKNIIIINTSSEYTISTLLAGGFHESI